MQVYNQIVRVDSQPEALIKASNTYQTACDVFGIEVLDHIVIGDGEHTSLREKGLM